MLSRAFPAAALLVTLAPGVQAVTEEECRAHREAFHQALAENREQRLESTREALRGELGAERRAAVRREGEQAWDHEERMRGMADRNFRDCMRYVREQAAGPRED